MSHVIAYPVEGILDVSTLHIAKSDTAILDLWAETEDAYATTKGQTAALAPVRCAKHAYGYFLGVPRRDGRQTFAAIVPTAPQSVLDIWTYAERRGCSFVLLDGSGQDHDELPTYEW